MFVDDAHEIQASLGTYDTLKTVFTMHLGVTPHTTPDPFNAICGLELAITLFGIQQERTSL